MWSRYLIKQAVSACRFHQTALRMPVQTVAHSFGVCHRFYATEPTEDLLFGLGQEGMEQTIGRRPKNYNRQSMKNRRIPLSQSASDEANIDDAINFNPEMGNRKSTVKRDRKKKVTTKDEPDYDAHQRIADAKIAKKKLKAAAPSFEKLTVSDAKLNLSYVRLPLDHPKLHKLLMLTRSKKLRSQKHYLMMEGNRLIVDALDAGLTLKYLFFSQIDKLDAVKELLHSKCVAGMPHIFRVPQHDLTFWSVMQTCPGLIAIFEKPQDMTAIWERARTQALGPEGEHNAPRITVICDQIREPSNIGSVIRTCAALPCAQVILMKGCTDPWDTKALRGGCGAQFRIPIRGPMEWSSLSSFLPASDQYSVFVATNKTETELDNSRRTHLTSKLYSDISYSNCDHVVLIIGGETEGISDDAFKFMASNKNDSATAPANTSIHIPLCNGIESLNSNAAAAIILFEIHKQMKEE